jgi:DeoR/GlpR family transcriptional regulator of sugar metabolism
MSIDANTGLAAERQQSIRELIRGQRIARVDELAEELKVSPATIRRDLEELDRHGVLHRVHGGAVAIEGSLEEPLFDDKTSIAAVEKEAIAEAALRFVRPKDTIYLDGGSTVLALARRLQAFTKELAKLIRNRFSGGTGPHRPKSCLNRSEAAMSWWVEVDQFLESFPRV